LDGWSILQINKDLTISINTLNITVGLAGTAASSSGNGGVGGTSSGQIGFTIRTGSKWQQY
jgi:hypothetical protein